MLGLPDGLGEVVAAAAFGQERDAGPGEKDAHDFRAEVGSHAHQFAQVDQLRFAVFGDGAAEIVVAGDGVNLDALVGGQFAELLAAGFRHVERIAVRTLAVDLDALVAEFLARPMTCSTVRASPRYQTPP